MSGLIKNLLFALGLALILWLGYAVFFADDEEDLAVENTSLTSAAARDTQDFLVLFNQLKEIELEQTLFNDPAFNSLIDYRQPIESEPVGRVNPFEPVESAE